MSDLLEDQKIFYIVKDYRRMFDNYSTLVSAIKKATEALKKKDNRIRDLEKQVASLQSKLTNTVSPEKSSAIMDAVVKTRDQVASIETRAGNILKYFNSLIGMLKDKEVESLELETNEENVL